MSDTLIDAPPDSKPPHGFDAERAIDCFKRYVVAIKHRKYSEATGPSRELRFMGFGLTWRPRPSERDGGRTR